MRTLQRSLARALRPSRHTTSALVANMLLTSLNAAALSLSVAAVGGQLSWALAVLVLSIGTFIGTALPTPGGIGGVEAGLAAGLLASNVPANIAVPAVLIYRALNYWLPIIPGIIAFKIVEKRLI